jgi:S-adenosylmethionine:diacylglycerol 3-amino-3-carboxypropyl transferase
MTSPIHFAQIREDSLLERTARDRRGARRIVCIGSGGCTALSLLSDAVDEVVAVDFSPAQCAVIELKLAAIEELDRDAYLAFIGELPSADRPATFARLAPRLSPAARDFWEKSPELVLVGANHAGTTERFYGYLGASMRTSVVPDEVWCSLFAARSVEEQREIHARHFTTEAWRTASRLLLSKTTHLLFFPAYMFANATEHDFGVFFGRQFDHEVTTKPLQDNYFLSQLLFGSYLYDRPEGTPGYLAASRWEETKRNAKKLRVVTAPIEGYLQRAEGVDAFFLSNVFDWLPPDGKAALGRAILRSASPRAVVLWRNMLSAAAPPAELAGRLAIDAEASAALHAMERSMSYQRVTLGTVE